MDEEDWLGLVVRARNGTALGVVVGAFAQGPLAGRLRVEGTYVPGPRDTVWPAGTATYAIPRARMRREQDGLVVDATPAQARGRWLMHIRPTTGDSGP